VIRAKERSHDMKASIDLLVDKLERQAQRLHDKRRKNHGRSHAQPPEAPALPAEEPASPIVKTKQFEVKPMSAEEAVLQLELIGHDFFMFLNADTDTVSVVYRRRDGGYGLIEPQLA
jgi:putative sigma-54 modulation protein